MSKAEQYIEIARYLAAEINNSLSLSERKQLEDWLNESEENRAISHEIKQELWLASQANEVEKYKPAEDWLVFASKIENSSSRVRFFRTFAKYAAALLLLVATVFFLIRQPSVTHELAMHSTSDSLIYPVGKGGRLVLDDGRVIPLSAEADFSLEAKDGTTIRKQAATISYLSNVSEGSAEVYNTIYTDSGEEFSLVLSDGSRVILNAESQIRFPVAFSGQQRKVEIKGEVYFEVAHNQLPFFVKTDKSLIEVLGTTFLIKAYADEPVEWTTLLEGSLMVGHPDKLSSSVLLKPGYQARIISPEIEISVREVDASLFTAWIDGMFIFRNERLEDIMRVLNRWYDFQLEFRHESLKDIRLGARLDRKEAVNQIFRIMNATELVFIKTEQNKVIIDLPQKSGS